MGRLHLAWVVVGLAFALWAAVERIDTLSDKANAAETRIETIKDTQEISRDVHSLDDDALGAELNSRLSGAVPE